MSTLFYKQKIGDIWINSYPNIESERGERKRVREIDIERSGMGNG